jgi:hypothetical protein
LEDEAGETLGQGLRTSGIREAGESPVVFHKFVSWRVSYRLVGIGRGRGKVIIAAIANTNPIIRLIAFADKQYQEDGKTPGVFIHSIPTNTIPIIETRM